MATTTPSTGRPNESEIETDITIYGATSFVARHILMYLKDVGPSLPRKLTITLAGRNESKLQKILQDNNNTDTTNSNNNISLDIFVAESTDAPALHTMASRTRTIINCAGPFEKYSSGVVKACADTGCDYTDITGEVHWVGAMRVKYGTAAAKSGARIISLCGFDSVPSDLSIFAAVQALRAKVPDAQVETARTWHSVFGMAGGGTLATMHQMQPDIGRCFLDSSNNNSLRPVPFLLFDPLVLTHPETVRFNPDHQDDRNRMALAEWWNLLPYPHTIFKQGVSIPFFMGVCNSKVVHASALALNYGPNISYYERFLPLGFELTLGFGLFSTIPSLIILFAIAMGGLILQIPILSDLLLKVFAPPGTGASDEMCAKGHAEVYAEVKAPLSVAGKVSCANVYMEFQGDPGNMVTAQCVVESALSLVLDRDNLPPRSKDGFGTPAELLGPVLLQRLRNTKVRPVTVKTNVRKSEREHEYKVYIF